MWRWTTSSYPRAGLGLYSPGHFLVGNVTGSHRRGLGQGRTMNHHLINEIGRQAVHYQLPGQKARAREGAAAMRPRTLGFNGLDSVWFYTATVSTYLPLGWGRRLGHDDGVPVVWDLRRGGAGWLPCLQRLLTPAPQSIKSNTPTHSEMSAGHLNVFQKERKLKVNFLFGKWRNAYLRKKIIIKTWIL